MALTDTQKANIRLALGYPDAWRNKSTRLESVLDNISPEAESQIEEILASLAAVDVAQTQTASLQSSLAVIQAAGVKRVDEITFFEPSTTQSSSSTSGLSGQGLAGTKLAKYFAGRLSIILGVPFNASAFSGQGYPGDDFIGGGSSGAIPIG